MKRRKFKLTNEELDTICHALYLHSWESYRKGFVHIAEEERDIFHKIKNYLDAKK